MGVERNSGGNSRGTRAGGGCSGWAGAKLSRVAPKRSDEGIQAASADCFIYFRHQSAVVSGIYSWLIVQHRNSFGFASRPARKSQPRTEFEVEGSTLLFLSGSVCVVLCSWGRQPDVGGGKYK